MKKNGLRNERLVYRGGYNVTSDGLSRCLRAGYYKAGQANFLSRDDGMRATCVIEVYEENVSEERPIVDD